jgi:hypothetical protein
MEVGTPQSLTSSAGTIHFNTFKASELGVIGVPDGNGYLLQSVIGNEMPGLRTPNDNRPHKSGGMLHPFFFGTKLIVLEGLVVAEAPAYRTLLDDHLRGVTDPGLKEDMTYTWSLPPAPYSTTRSHTVRLYAGVEILGRTSTGGMDAGPKLFHIELIAYKTDTEQY